MDIVFGVNHGPARVLRNDGGRQWQMVRSGSSYCSQSDLSLTFGIGQDTSAARIEIEWPSGTREHYTNIRANQFLRLEEGRGLQP